MEDGPRITQRLGRRLGRTGDPRLAQAAGVGALCAVIGLVLGLWLDRPAILGVAGLMLIGAMMALIALDEQMRAAIYPGQPPVPPPPLAEGRTIEGEPVIREALPTSSRGTAPALAAGVVLRHRTYPTALARLLAADDTHLPTGHAWPDLSRVRGSLAVRAQMAVRFNGLGPVAASAPEAPMYVGYLHAVDVALGLHVAALGWRATPVAAFLDASMHPGLSEDERIKIDDAMAAAWHAKLSDTLTPPPVLDVLQDIGLDPTGPGGAWVLEWLEGVRMALRGGSGINAILLPWATWRAQLANEAHRGGWSERQRDGAELICDWLLLQRACAEDLAIADRDRNPSETRGDALSRRDGSGPFTVELALEALLDDTSVGRTAPEAARVAAVALHEANQALVTSVAA